MPPLSKGRFLLDSALVAVLGIAVVGAVGSRRQGDDYKFLDPLIEAKHIITKEFYEEPNLDKLQEGAIKGMVEALDDPYTVYVPPSEKAEFNKELLGEYVGIGASVNVVEGWLTIVSPLEDSPAFRVGLMAEDRVVEINGTSTHNLPVDKCVEMLLGEPGTKVQLLVERKGARIPFEIERAPIKTRAVKGYHRADNDAESWMYLIDPARRIAYVRLTQFTPKCSEEVAAALLSVGADKGQLRGLVLDLRFNPGGLLNEAAEIADLFLKSGTIVSTKGRAFPEEVATAVEQGTLPEFPIAVLLNASSASASEVLAGALSENNRAIIVGTRSFGKGSVQTVRRIPSNGGELKITGQGYYLPSGRSISRKDDSPTWGVDPSEGFYVPMSDPELIAMLDVRRKQEVLRSSAEKSDANDQPANWTDTAWVLETLKDKQLTAAVRAMQGKIDSGNWTPTGEKVDQAKAIASEELKRQSLLRDRLERELIRVDKRIAALEDAAPDAPKTDLWPDDLDLTGGIMEIKDKDGKVVVTLQITGNNLERWLVDADVKKKE
jgi:carboxyl-terminal processing protease